jgi:hypothetical protein
LKPLFDLGLVPDSIRFKQGGLSKSGLALCDGCFCLTQG